MGIILGPISIYCTRKWYKNIRETDKTKGKTIANILLMIFGILTTIVGILSLIFVLAFS
ncbi:MAG: hypothetical protein ACFFDN_00210 [Candidatus Hodarchaeota archaeon]